MRIIAIKTLQLILEKNPSLIAPLTAWYSEVEESDWTGPSDLKVHFGSASVLSSKSRKSDILSRRRKLNLNMIRKLHKELNIPAEILIRDY